MTLCSDNDVVDGDVDELDEEPNEAHEAKPDGRGDGDLREFFPEGLRINFHCQDYLLLVLVSHLSGLVHLFTSLMESLPNCFRGSICCVIWSIALFKEDLSAGGIC